MRIVFIADAHLRGTEDENQRRLVEFLDWLATERPDKLVILGDLFEFWTGFNGVIYSHYFPVLKGFELLKNAGTEIIYLEGNHDFSLGPFFTGFLGAKVYRDSATIELDGKRFYLAHGDIVDPSLGYNLWRWFLRSPIFRLILMVVHPSFMWKIAMRLSDRGKLYPERASTIERRHREFAKRRIMAGYDVVVLAHSHIQGIERLTTDRKEGIYANPGGWREACKYMVYQDGEFMLKKYS